VYVSLRPSDLKESFLTHHDLKPGQIVDGKIVAIGTVPSSFEFHLDFSQDLFQSPVQPLLLSLKFMDGFAGSYGLKVKLSHVVTAVCPPTHMADVILKNPGAKFKVNQKLKFRVFSVSAPRESHNYLPFVTLTRRKVLLFLFFVLNRFV
jgi:hypothetical protein